MKIRRLITQPGLSLGATVLPVLALVSTNPALAEGGTDADFVVTVSAPRPEYRPPAQLTVTDRDSLPDRPDADVLFDLSALLSVHEDELGAALAQVLEGIDLYRRQD